MLYLLLVDLHLSFDGVQVFDAFLHLIPLQLIVVCCFGALHLGCPQSHVFLLELLLSHLLVFFQLCNQGVLLKLNFLQVNKLS